MRRRLVVLLVLLSAIAPAGISTAQEPSRAERVRERLKTRPNDPTLHFYLALFEIGDGHKDSGIAELREVARLGRGFLPPSDGAFAALSGDTAFQRVRAELEQKLPRVTDARELFRLDKAFVPEGIAWDPQGRAWYVGSVATGAIVRVDPAGAVTAFAPAAERRPVLGLAVDAARRR